MKLSVLALDYDGTIAYSDQLDSTARDAIADARTRGIVVLLVTGRTLDELRRVAGDLHVFDGVIAENGAVIHFPDSGYSSTLAPALPERFLAEVRRRGIVATAGQCLLDAHADDAPRLLEVIQTQELPFVLLFNRSRVMTLPQGISKATGLHIALDMLRLSARNMVAIGDAENDHPLLQLGEVGVAVEWGSEALRADADMVLPGSGPAAVGGHIHELAERGRLPVPPKARRRLKLGYTEDGREFSLAVRGRNVLNGYTVVTYCASRLPKELLAATEVMLVTCESNPAEIDALCARCEPCHSVENARIHWSALAHLALGHVALPITEESGGELKMFTIGQRLTPHVRHREKYVDVPVTDARAFQFAGNGGPPRRLRTLRQFVATLEEAPPVSVIPYLRRGDFSRWIADVFGDNALADELRAEEQRFRSKSDTDVVPEIVDAIRARYDLTESL